MKLSFCEAVVLKRPLWIPSPHPFTIYIKYTNSSQFQSFFKHNLCLSSRLGWMSYPLHWTYLPYRERDTIFCLHWVLNLYYKQWVTWKGKWSKNVILKRPEPKKNSDSPWDTSGEWTTNCHVSLKPEIEWEKFRKK